MQLKSQKDLVTGLIFMIVGAVFAFTARGYRMGTARGMGPGYFPFILAVILVVVGLVVAISALIGSDRPDERFQRIRFRPVLCVLGAMAVFGVLLGGISAIGLPPLGLLVAILGLVIVVGLSMPSPNPVEIALTAGLLAGLCYVIFHILLQLPVPFWPPLL